MGILLISTAQVETKIRRKRPWKKLDQRVRAPLAILAVLLTISAIIGRPPIMPDTALPSPTAARSRLLFACRLYGSSLSTAEQLSTVSIPWTRVMDMTHDQKAALDMAPQSGPV